MYGIHASPPLFWFSNSNFKCRICSIFAYSPKFLCKSFISLQPLTFPFPIDKIIMDRIKNHKKSHKLLWSFYGQSMPLWTVAVFLLLLPNCKVELSTLSITRAVTPYCVANRSPILTQHANSLRVICRRIASTACVPSQAPFPQVSTKRKLAEIGLHGAYPPVPLKAKNNRRLRHIWKSFI